MSDRKCVMSTRKYTASSVVRTVNKKIKNGQKIKIN